MREWLESLQPRERWMVFGCAAFVALVVLYLAVLRPLYGGVSRAETRIQEKRQLLADIKSAAAQVRSGGRTVRVIDTSQSLVVVVDQTTRKSGLAGVLKRNQPNGDNGIRVRFDDAPFDQVLSWLGNVQVDYGLSIVSASFDGGAQIGQVTANLVLERPAS
ncbi:MAG: type II secretion system protein M [Chromatiales bacterium]|jgi:general secretion pathway protein M|nr:type II secretion system protein M [Chromatiales bacterium]MDH3894120.1 type II secretion system protein M [Chromatiales bacterium]MDH4012536.1 type II secretion system protein M [Chromatiales bacterium]PLX56181.1 MAG: hypothetical protein C0629_08680 [Chromatiales bacterium]